MVTPVIVVAEATTLEEIAKILLGNRIGGVPVVDPAGKLCGIVTESDFAAKECGIPFSLVRAPQLFGAWLGPSGVEHVYRECKSLTARHIMESRVVTVSEDDPIDRVVQLLMRHDINRVPVVRDGRPVGIVARHDLLKLMLDGKVKAE
jgi:CBS domain-containing protein